MYSTEFSFIKAWKIKAFGQHFEAIHRHHFKFPKLSRESDNKTRSTVTNEHSLFQSNYCRLFLMESKRDIKGVTANVNKM